MNWDRFKIQYAKDYLSSSKSVEDAAERLTEFFDEKVTASSMRNAFKRAGADSPQSYLPNQPVYSLDSASVFYNGQELSQLTEIQYSTHNNEIRDSLNKITSRLVTNPEPSVKKIIVCPDAHHPYVDKKAWKCFLKSIAAVKPDVVILIGDFGDLLSVSAHPKKPKDERSLKRELKSINTALDELRAVHSGKLVYIFGNHESRYDRYLASNAPELDGIYSLKDLLRLDERNIQYVPYGDFYRLGEMVFTHDVGRCGVNTARQSLQDMGDNICVGHSHRASVVYSGTVEGKTHVGLNVGWLGDYNAIDYRNRHTAKREWQHSFGMIYQDKKGISYCNLVPIINGSCIVDGKYVSA